MLIEYDLSPAIGFEVRKKTKSPKKLRKLHEFLS